MLAKLRPRSLYDVLAVIGCFAGLATGGAYAADTVGSSDVINETLLSEDFKNGEVKQQDLANGAVTGGKLAANSVLNPKLAANSVSSAKVLDFDLTNQDVGVLFAEVSSTATLSNSSGGVTVARIGAVGAGRYAVDFGRDITLCTAVATVGPASTGLTEGQVSVADRTGDVEAVVADTNTSTGAAADLPFRLVVVC
jgi:hypothetical protein